MTDSVWPPEGDSKLYRAWLREVDTGLQQALNVRARDVIAPFLTWFADGVTVEEAVARVVKIAQSIGVRGEHGRS